MERSSLSRGRHTPEKRAASRRMRREMTPAEAALWQRLRAGRLDGFHFRRQQIIDGFIADFYCYAARLVIEVDGGVHDEQRDYDAARDRIIAARGLRVLRLTNEQVLRDLPATLHAIRDAAQCRDVQGESPPPLNGEGAGGWV